MEKFDLEKHTTPTALERYAFYWTEARLVIAAVALFLGGVPPIFYISGVFQFLSGITTLFLSLAWIISGAVSAYLLYRWKIAGKTVFGGKDHKDVVAFFAAIITGFNLGIAGLMGKNIGMTLVSFNKTIFLVAGVVYLLVALYLFQRWKAHGEKFF